jgi:ribosomal protein L37AE/L43A
VSGHLSPFYCPYCGDEDIRPHGEAHGEWACGSCRRVFALRAVRPGSPAPRPTRAEVAR